MKNAFYFVWKALLVLKIFRFLAWIFGFVGKRLEWKLWLISKSMTAKATQQIITAYILSNMSRSKDNLGKKICQLYNVRNISFENLKLLSMLHFLNDFWRKIILTLYFINWTSFNTWLPLRLEILANMCIGIICCQACGIKNFEIDLCFLIKPYLYITEKSGQKCKYIKKEKSFYYEIKNHFPSFIKGCQLLKMVSDPRTGR